MYRLLISSLSMLLITVSSVRAADESTAAPKTPSLVIGTAALAEAAQSAVASSSTSTLKTPQAPTRPLVLPALYATSVGLQAFDVYSTMSAMKLGAVEQNPVMQGVVSNPAAFIAVKAGVTAASVAAAERLWRGNHRMGAIGLMVAANVMMGVVAAHNASVLSTLQQR